MGDAPLLISPSLRRRTLLRAGLACSACILVALAVRPRQGGGAESGGAVSASGLAPDDGSDKLNLERTDAYAALGSFATYWTPGAPWPWGAYAAQFPCILEIDYGRFTVSANRTSALSAETPCTLWLVVDRRATVRQTDAPVESKPAFVLLQTATSVEYALSKYSFGVMSANAYACTHGYRHFLYTSPEKLSADGPDRWLNYLFPKKNGTEAVFRLLDNDGSPERAVLFVDFDGWFNLARHANYSLESLEQRLVRNRLGGALEAASGGLRYPHEPASNSKASSVAPAKPEFDVIVQGEPGLCSCIMIMYRTPFGRRFWSDIESECLVRPQIGTENRTRPLCSKGPWEQMGFFRVIFKHLNGTAGLAIPENVCLDFNYMCARNTFMGFGNAENESVRWSHFAFVPKTGRIGQPQLHGCLNFANCQPLRESIWYHTGSPKYQEDKQQPENDFHDYIQRLASGSA